MSAVNVCSFGFALSLMLGGAMPTSYVNPAKDVNQEILSAQQRIAATSDSNDRAVLMLELVHELSALEPSQVNSVSDDAVDAVAATLKLDRDVGSYYGAKALSAIACRADRSLPILREALELSAPVRSDFEPLVLAPSVSPHAEIEAAIAKIEEARPCP